MFLLELSGTTLIREDILCVSELKNALRTSWQVSHGEGVLYKVAGLSVTPTLQAGVFLLRRLQHVVTAQTLEKEKR